MKLMAKGKATEETPVVNVQDETNYNSATKVRISEILKNMGPGA